MLLRIDGEQLFPAWNESLPHKTWTTLDVHEDVVSVTKGVSLNGGSLPGIILGNMATGMKGGRCLPGFEQRGLGPLGIYPQGLSAKLAEPWKISVTNRRRNFYHDS